MIVATRGGNRQVRTANLAGLGITQTAYGMPAPAVALNSSNAGGIPAVHQACRIAATAVASLDIGSYRGQGLAKTQVLATSTARLLAGEPNDQQTRFEFWEAVEESLSYRSNAYIWMNPDPKTGLIVEWYALHPDQVQPVMLAGGKRRYLVGVSPLYVDPTGSGYGFYEVDETTILHIKGFGDGGAWIAPSPIERCQLALATSLAKIGHENSVYGKGASVRGAVTFPDGLKKEHVDQWKETFQATYEGPGNAGKTIVLGGGATFTPIGLTMADAQFVETEQFDVEQVARIFNVPASMLGGGGTSGGRAQAPLTPEHESQRWLTYGLGPRLFRIESALNACQALFQRSRKDYAWFNTTRLVRGDSSTEAQISLTKVQSGQWLVDEARALDGMPPLPNGAGQIPQITPVGGGANPDFSGVDSTGKNHPNDNPDGGA